jgi:uncharacterized protein YrrD
LENLLRSGPNLRDIFLDQASEGFGCVLINQRSAIRNHFEVQVEEVISNFSKAISCQCKT